MNWFMVGGSAVVWTLIFVVVLRTDLRARWAGLLLFAVPGLGLLCFWAAYRAQFNALWVGLGLGVLVTLVWWLAWGRRLPPQDSDKIKVWEKE